MAATKLTESDFNKTLMRKWFSCIQDLKKYQEKCIWYALLKKKDPVEGGVERFWSCIVTGFKVVGPGPLA